MMDSDSITTLKALLEDKLRGTTARVIIIEVDRAGGGAIILETPEPEKICKVWMKPGPAGFPLYGLHTMGMRASGDGGPDCVFSSARMLARYVRALLGFPREEGA